ncbi:epoxide hydrolase [Phlyctema vagabunda]|uniref:Epoxide hydrolase n=1 Tax=Phlyctema vagabunda TaxID=108571 RepID=A0ABR4PL53_9HELO
MDQNPESVVSLFHSHDEELGKKYIGAQGGFREWLTKGRVAERPSYFSSEDTAQHLKQFSIEKGGYGPAINWYRAQLQNINEADEKAIRQEAHILHRPTLLFTSHNFITVAGNPAEQMKPLVSDFTTKEINSGHWIQREKADEVNSILQDFFGH